MIHGPAIAASSPGPSTAYLSQQQPVTARSVGAMVRSGPMIMRIKA